MSLDSFIQRELDRRGWSQQDLERESGVPDSTISRIRHGGARRGSGRKRTRRTITPNAATALQLIAWIRVGRPTTPEEEDDVLTQLILEEQARVAPPLTDEQRAASRTSTVTRTTALSS